MHEFSVEGVGAFRGGGLLFWWVNPGGGWQPGWLWGFSLEARWMGFAQAARVFFSDKPGVDELRDAALHLPLKLAEGLVRSRGKLNPPNHAGVSRRPKG